MIGYLAMYVEAARFLRRVMPRPGFMPAQGSRLRRKRLHNWDGFGYLLTEDGIRSVPYKHGREGWPSGRSNGKRGHRPGGCVRRHMAAA